MDRDCRRRGLADRLRVKHGPGRSPSAIAKSEKFAFSAERERIGLWISCVAGLLQRPVQWFRPLWAQTFGWIATPLVEVRAPTAPSVVIDTLPLLEVPPQFEG